MISNTFLRDSLLMAYVNNTPPINYPLDFFVTTWVLPSGDFTIPTQPFDYDCTIYWGDGTSSSHISGNPIHNYLNGGTYQVGISGNYSGINMFNATSADNYTLTAINQWGTVGFSSFEYAFFKCANLSYLPNSAITGIENCTSFKGAFKWSGITHIPSNFLENGLNIETFYNCFGGCKLSYLPNNLFINCINVLDYTYCFLSCPSMIIPDTLFNLQALQSKQPNMKSCFIATAGLSHTGTVQDIWNYINTSVDNNCFKYCTELTNSSSIPTLWK